MMSGAVTYAPPTAIGSMSLQPAIPPRVALQQSLPTKCIFTLPGESVKDVMELDAYVCNEGDLSC
jgi:hypothetical protein